MQYKAFNVKVMDVEDFIVRHQCSAVESTFITEPSSSSFHPSGIFSEDIFGQLNTADRLLRFGYVNLNTAIIAPVLLKMVKLIAPWHMEVMAGKLHAVWDEKTRTLTKSVTGEGDTGYSFYINIFPKIKFQDSKSISRSEKIAVLNKERKLGVYMKYLVEPAGYRDITQDATGRQTIEDINKLYIQLLAYTKSLAPNSTNPIFDSIKYNIQSKAMEIFSYIENILNGKRGFLRGQYGHRNIALGTANVITATSYSAKSPDDPQFLKPDETRVGLFQTMKGTQPKIINHLRTMFFNPTFGTDLDQVSTPLTRSDNYELEYVNVSVDEREKFTGEEEIIAMISKFRSLDFRNKPVIVKDVEGSEYYLRAIYDDGKNIFIFTSLEDLRRSIPDYKEQYIRPMEYIDMFYIATAPAIMNVHCFITRYPVLGDKSCYPSKVHLATTTPARVVAFKDLADPADEGITLPEYPILGKPFVDGVSLASPRLAGLGADHDGDRVSVNFILSTDGNEEIREYQNSPRALVDTNADLISSASTDLIDYTLFALTHAKEDL